MNSINKCDKRIRGITLISLIITIVLLILAGISIQILTGENSILKQATKAKEQTEIAQLKERIILAHNSAIIRDELENIDVLQMMNEELKKEYSDINLKPLGKNYIVQLGTEQEYMFINNKLIDMQPGLYDEFGNLVYTWKELLDNNFLSVNDGTMTSYTDSETNQNLTIKNIKGNLVLDTSVKIIGESVFKKCVGLMGIVIPDSVTYKEIEYTSKSELENALASNGVILETQVFYNTKLGI